MSEWGAFLSYAHRDDKAEGGRLREIAARLEGEVRQRTGSEEFGIFVDRDSIPWGANWERALSEGLEQSGFLIPIITPSYFASPNCQGELAKFLAKEEQLGRNDLVCPIYYIEVDLFVDDSLRSRNELASALFQHQHVDWLDLRLSSLSTIRVRKALIELAVRLKRSAAASRAVKMGTGNGAVNEGRTQAMGGEVAAPVPAFDRAQASAKVPDSPTEPGITSDDEQALVRLNERFAEAEAGRDISFFASVLSDDLVLTKSNGVRVGKAQFLEGVSYLPPNPYAFFAEDVAVVSQGEGEAVVSLRVRVAGEGIETWFRSTRVFVKRNGAWTCVVWVNTKEHV